MSGETWRHVRAALLAVVILAHGLVALPFGPRITDKSLQLDKARSEVDAWMKLAGPLGFTRASFEQTLITWSDRLVTLDGWATAPFKPFLRFTRTGQGWALFANPDMDPLTFEVHGIDAQGQERVLFRRLDPQATFLSDVFAFRRVRGVYDLTGTGMPPRYTNLGRWVADQAFDAFPEVVTVRIVQVEHKTALPGREVSTETKERFKMRFERTSP